MKEHTYICVLCRKVRRCTTRKCRGVGDVRMTYVNRCVPICRTCLREQRDMYTFRRKSEAQRRACGVRP